MNNGIPKIGEFRTMDRLLNRAEIATGARLRKADPVGPDPVPAVKKDDPIILQAIADGKRVAAEKLERQAALERNTQTILSQVSGLPPERLGELVKD
jgi:hypothetical protein